MNQKYLLAVLLTLISLNAQTQLDQFHSGPIIKNFGKIADVNGMEPIPENTSFKISFDLAKQADLGSVNRNLDSAARFINMHVAAGVAVKNIDLAMVIHGSAVRDMTKNNRYHALKSNKTNANNLNLELIDALNKQGVKFYVCGQSAAYYGVKTEDLAPGVTMSLSAMTAHAQLQQQGYSLNPF